MAFEWVAGLFQSDNQQTRGLSGDQAGVALDDANPYYNYRLRRHKAEGDLITDPGLLWYTSPYVKRRSGLGTHVGADVGDGTANYTDVLLILSKEDFARATPEWQAAAAAVLQQEFDNFCRRDNFHRAHPHRPLGVKMIEDGSTAMFGQSLQLSRGEFITGLLPNLYTGAVRGSYPVIAVHLNLPGVWEGYQEVGRLHNDQILFTIGNHWLDNFSHPSLQQAALYRLRQYQDGSFVHIVNPDLQDQYQVTSTNQGSGASVLTLATRAGQPLAYMVLAVIDPPATRPTTPKPAPAATSPGQAVAPSAPVAPPRRPDITLPKQPAPSPGPRTRDGVPSIAPPMMIEDVSPGGSIGLGGKTIIPDAPSERIFTLQERGALLQKVHFSQFMLGYDVYLGARGELGTHVEDPAATFQVRRRTVALVAHVDGVMVEGRPVAAGVEVPIEGDVRIEVAGQKLEYRDLRGLQLDGWPYVGEIRRPTSSTYMIWGEDYQIGRSRECRVVLPDEPRNDNIHWKPSVGDGATIRARTGEIPKSRFYTDSIMVASEHASVDLRADRPKVVCTARHCYAYVRRGSEVFSLYPTTSAQVPKELELQPGDEILIGNCLFHVGYTAGEAVAPAPAPDLAVAEREPAAELSNRRPATPAGAAEALAAGVAAPNVAALDADTGPGAPPRQTSRPVMEELPPPLPREDTEPPLLPEDSTAHTMGPHVAEPEPSPADAGLDDVVHDVAGWDLDDWVDAETESAPPPLRPAVEPIPAEEPRLSVDLEPDDPALTSGGPVGTAAETTGPVATRAQGAVVYVDDAEAQFEIGRPLHLVLVGWMVNGEVVCGNHRGADLVVPENRIRPDQVLVPCDYFRLRVRGRKGTLEVLARGEVEIDGSAPAASYEDPEAHQIDVIRRDDAGERDFVVGLRLEEDRRLPDPRARFVALDTQEPLAAALVTRGLPKATPRTLELQGMKLTFLFDGAAIRVSDYLATYRRGDTFHPFFVQRGEERFKTAPEDGAAFEVRPGDRLVIGSSVYVLRAE